MYAPVSNDQPEGEENPLVPPAVRGGNPFELSGEWVKAALPDHLAMAYEGAGFDVLAVTDHWRLTQIPSTDRLLTIPSAELGWDIRRPVYPRQSAEFLVYGIDHIPDDPGGDKANWYSNPDEHYEVRTFPDLTAGVRWADAQGAVVYVAHPYWNQLDLADIEEQSGFVGLEVYNGSSDLETGRGDSSPWWDALLGKGRRVFGIGTDDQHYPLFDLGTGWTMLRVAERTQEAVLGALRNGHSYFSNGPAIHHIEDLGHAVVVECSPARTIHLQMEEELGLGVTVGRDGRRMGRILATDGTGLITKALLEPTTETPRYRRVTVVDAAGRRAWSNPL
jgi:hypothetical protein